MSRRPDRSDLAVEVAQLREELRCSRREDHRLRSEDEILREAAQPLIHHAPPRDRFAFIHARRGRFSVKRLCKALVTGH